MTHPLRISLRRLAAFLPALGLLASCAYGPPSARVSPGERTVACANASLVNPFGGGLGGTGAPKTAALDPGGIGGTGQKTLPARQLEGERFAAEGGLGGTGIVGVVTGFSSICVNGLKVDYEQGTAVSRDGVAVDTGVLAVGQVVALEAVQVGARLGAKRIDVLDSVVGPIAAINTETGRFAVLGQIAQAQETADLAGLVVGDWVRVSGLTRAGGEIRATRVLRAEPGMALLRGQARAKTASGFMIGATRVDARQLRWMAELDEGEEVQVRGTWDGVQLNAASGTLEPTQALISRSREVVLEGYVHEIQGDSLALGYSRFTLGPSTSVSGARADALRVGQKIQVRGRVGSDLKLVASRVQLLREGSRSEGSRSQAATASSPTSGSKNSSDDDSDDRDDDDDDDSSGGSGSNSGSGSSGSGSSGSGSSGSGSSGSGSSGSGSSGSGSSGSGSSGSGSSGSRTSGSGSSGSGSSGSGSSGSGSSGSDSSGSGSSGGDSGGKGRGRGRGGSG